MYLDDHVPPHFHARDGNGEARIRIDTLAVMAGESLGRRQLRLVLAWAEICIERSSTELASGSPTMRH